MNKTFRYSLLASALMLAGQAHAGKIIPFNVDTSVVPGSTTAYEFTADEMIWTSQGVSDVTVTDASGDGTLDGIDSFFEIGVIDIVSFQLDNSSLLAGNTGLGVGYQLMVDFTFSGYTQLLPSGELKAVFTDGGGSFWYDEALDSELNGTETEVTQFSFNPLEGSKGECFIRNSFANGDCKLRVSFDSSMTPGFMTDADTGLDLVYDPTDPFWMVVDVNVNNLVPALELIYPGGPFSSQNTKLDHDGSAQFIPEPGILGLLGIGTLGLAGIRRKRS